MVAQASASGVGQFSTGLGSSDRAVQTSGASVRVANARVALVRLAQCREARVMVAWFRA